ncbi:serine/threonine-protein kinase PknG [Amycolatopsis lurida]|uniref:non-specific serine/threonine protein kinase n=1 Tax=Amycolatopsis lurida NRRL 2430 TaxID=1460371 RepID=A0A2P2FV52_AMYLU|nr:serine/threonine-protein kinase [Amycolatopsis lurida]KFU80592.1 serine/threonine protein kinase [Amycolatopsis lurida NRRL 2430]SED48415.1 serine/threonine-protein kinase PknG [Amycolatopsis lurida]
MSEEPRRPRHAAPDDATPDREAESASWTPPAPVRWDTPEPSISGRLDLSDPSRPKQEPRPESDAERTAIHAPVQRPQTPPRGRQRPIPGAEDPTRPPGDMAPVSPKNQASADAPQPTSVLASPAPETQSIMPPTPRVDNGPGQLPDPGTESVLPERPSESRGTGTGTGSGSRGTGTGTGTGSFPGTARRTSSRTSRRGRLGAGLVDVPQVPYRDPASAVLDNPMVSEEKRFCGSCGAKVGRGKDGKPGSPEGNCEKCGNPFSFVPKLRPNEIVGGQYEVLGALAYGGLGWIYLAQDHNVSDRWVVLKGLIDTGDATAMAAAANEQRFLAEVEHPNIVKIHNFVQHPDGDTGNSVGYIVMEYVGGQSLRQLALAHHRETKRPEPLPIGQVIAYGLEILPAMGYLHGQNLLYCDLKPDNVIQTHEQLKLIDLGAVRRIDDYESPLFFTTGYSAPELATHGASVASDLYTVGRTLAVLSFEFSGYTTKYKTTLPGPDVVPLFALFGSYHRFLKRATHTDPDRRFIAAEEMADQLTGVLREIMALGTGKPRPGASTVFGPETRTFGVDMVVPEHGGSVPLPDAGEVVTGLPIPQVDTDDAAAGVLASTVALDPKGAIESLAGAPRESIEVRLRIVRARIELGELVEAQRQLQAAQYLAIKAGFPHDWRIDWYRGLIELAGGRSRVAQVAFEAVYDDLPGEIAPKLALAVSAEGVGDYFGAARYYELVWRTDRSYVSAAFGLARVYLAQGARASAIEVLEAVPASSTHYVAAQVAAIKIKTRINGGGKDPVMVSERDLVDASTRLERLQLDAERRTRLSAEVLEAAYGWLNSQNRPTPGAKVLGCDLDERGLRFGLERCYRTLARLAGSVDQRVELVDKANAIRPRTLT